MQTPRSDSALQIPYLSGHRVLTLVPIEVARDIERDLIREKAISDRFHEELKELKYRLNSLEK